MSVFLEGFSFLGRHALCVVPDYGQPLWTLLWLVEYLAWGYRPFSNDVNMCRHIQTGHIPLLKIMVEVGKMSGFVFFIFCWFYLNKNTWAQLVWSVAHVRYQAWSNMDHSLVHHHKFPDSNRLSNSQMVLPFAKWNGLALCKMILQA